MPVLLELTKFRLSSLVLLTTASGAWLAMREPAAWPLVLPALLGTLLVVGGANALNEWWERDADRLMARTRNRPVPSGRMAPGTAFRIGFGLIVAGTLLLGLAVNLLSASLAAFGAAVYVLIYTPLKRVTPLCTLVGGVPGAIPPLIGWATIRGELGDPAWALFLILFLWQLPHFLALAILYQEDYARAGFKMLPIIEATQGAATARQIVLYAAALLPASLLPYLVGVAGPWYVGGAVVCGVAFLAVSIRAALARTRESARRLFHASIAYLPALLLLLACDRRAAP